MVVIELSTRVHGTHVPTTVSLSRQEESLVCNIKFDKEFCVGTGEWGPSDCVDISNKISRIKYRILFTTYGM